MSVNPGVEFPDPEPLREWLRQHMEDGVHCPACTQNVKVYKRHISSFQARSLIAVHKKRGRGWSKVAEDVPWVMRQGGMWALLRHWKLIEEELDLRPDGGRKGVWRLTELGEQYVTRGLAVPYEARTFANRLLGYTDVDNRRTIQDALGDHFNYNDLMGA